VVAVQIADNEPRPQGAVDVGVSLNSSEVTRLDATTVRIPSPPRGFRIFRNSCDGRIVPDPLAYRLGSAAWTGRSVSSW